MHIIWTPRGNSFFESRSRRRALNVSQRIEPHKTRPESIRADSKSGQEVYCHADAEEPPPCTLKALDPVPIVDESSYRNAEFNVALSKKFADREAGFRGGARGVECPGALSGSKQAELGTEEEGKGEVGNVSRRWVEYCRIRSSHVASLTLLVMFVVLLATVEYISNKLPARVHEGIVEALVELVGFLIDVFGMRCCFCQWRRIVGYVVREDTFSKTGSDVGNRLVSGGGCGEHCWLLELCLRR